MRVFEWNSPRHDADWNECYAAITRELDFDERREDPRGRAHLMRGVALSRPAQRVMNEMTGNAS